MEIVDIHQYSSLKVHFGALASVGRGVCKKTDDLVERGFVVACVFIDVLEVAQLLDGGLVDNPRGVHQIDPLEAFLKDIPRFLKALPFDNWLMLVGHEFGDYTSRFAHGQVVLFLVVYHGVYEDIGLELCIGKSFFDEIVSDGFNCRPFSPRDCPLAFLLSKFAHYL